MVNASRRIAAHQRVDRERLKHAIAQFRFVRAPFVRARFAPSRFVRARFVASRIIHPSAPADQPSARRHASHPRLALE
jgi:hypothetical protein